MGFRIKQTRFSSFIVVLLALCACSDPVIPLVAPPPEPTPVQTLVTSPEITTGEDEVEPQERGTTATTLRIAVIADGPDDSLNDGEAISVWQSVEAWANSVNRSTKLAGREIIVERVDSAIFRHVEALNFVCEGDFFAIVGSFALNDSDGLEQLLSPNCSLPDFPANVFSLTRLYSGLTFQSNPTGAITTSAGWASYFAEIDQSSSQEAATLMPELTSTVLAGERIIESATAKGFKFVHSPIYEIESDFSKETEALILTNSKSLVWGNSGSQLTRFLNSIEAYEPDFSFEFITCGQACYNPDWIQNAGLAAEGVSIWLPHLPIEEAELNDELLRYLFFMNSTHGTEAKPTAAGIAAWSAALLFEEAVSRAVGTGSAAYRPESLTRQSVIEAAQGITFWDASGLHGISNPAEGIPSPCFVIMTLTDGLWERTFPQRPGELSCEDQNLVVLEATADFEAIEGNSQSPE
ncbi:MAG: ABC transporter substrate-binding protein [Acidimicrobiales bacterium]|jgi:hypothetical protein|nr:ABC transporter substrate-binding protein [Acidimicrobiales bacterium]MDP6298328.1 ABC transporter substrate-binding protein [Acidimicrobiales bacterium]HJM28145.1 ABC transporter substrate-binding protein [Acidimicrobiales bacterium]HJM98448.1 ABC transporter substrate-binding protein [Acidimicrobiales bacterium]